ncbi:hypothetical protein [Streptomyces sp. e14]|uniref:hypothetical protein n=1 Tax=Streptomyces sp. e14 TaxID=645465 RepID=UPI0002EE3FDD|nr:hypothetical protein [Streptomyces sp. e14]
MTCQVIEDSLCLRRMHLNPDAGPALDEYAAAFERVWENLDVIARFARALDYAPPWAAVKGYEQKAGVPA